MTDVPSQLTWDVNGPGFIPAGTMLAIRAEPWTAVSGRTVVQDRTLGRAGIKVSACRWAR
jgi:hypothetical protein